MLDQYDDHDQHAGTAAAQDRRGTVVLHVNDGPRRLGRALAVCVAVLILAGIASNLLKFVFGFDSAWGFVTLFDLDGEANVTAWFSSVLMLASAVLLGAIGAAAVGVRDRWRWHWAGLAAIFFLLSLDEIASIHERAIVPLREGLDLSGPLHFAWVVPAGILLVLFGIAYARFVLALRGDTRWRFVLAGAIYVSGVLGMEMVGGAVASAGGQGQLGYSLITTCEESLEMIGLALFVYALARHIRAQWSALTLRFDA